MGTSDIKASLKWGWEESNKEGKDHGKEIIISEATPLGSQAEMGSDVSVRAWRGIAAQAVYPL